MKKFLNLRYPPRAGIAQFLLKMKLLTAFLIMALAAGAGNSYSQQTKFSFRLNGATVREVFQQIEENSEFIFLYNERSVDLERKVNIRVKDETVESVMEQLFKGTGNTWKVYDRQIVVLDVKETELPPPPKKQLNELPQQPQRREINGSVKDEKGAPLPGVSVVVQGTTIGTITDFNGNFSFQVPFDSKTLVFSFVGMKTKEVAIEGQSRFDVVLEEVAVGIDEVVVVGFGTQKKATITGAIASIKSTELLQSPQANISNSLVGRLPGLLAVQRSGQPGADASIIRIRGIGTFTGVQDPLIMVDGIETDNFNNIDPNEIESVSILKDASATAVYGVRGANGVLIITTRRGIESKPQVSYSAQRAVSRFIDIRHSMNAYEYATSFNLARRYDGYITGNYTPAYTEEAIRKYQTQEDPIFYPDIDWFDYMFNKSSGQNQHNLNITGGTADVKYFASIGYFDQEGLINHTDLIKDYDAQLIFKRYNIRSNFDFNITKRFSTSISLSSQIENRSGAAAEIPRVFDACWAANPTDFPLIVDGKFIRLDDIRSNGSNPITFLFQDGYQKNYRNYLNSSVRFNYDLADITPGLSARATISYNNYNMQNIRYSKEFVTYRAQRLEDQSIVFIPRSDPTPFGFSESFGKNRKTYFEAGFDYNRKFGSHTVGGLLLYNQSKRHDPNLAFLVANGYQGIVGRVTYDYKTRYMAEFNMGYNGTENFAPGKRFGFFPAYSLGWVASDEPFFPKTPLINYLKIRGAYGVVGNDKIGGNRFLYRPAAYSYMSGFYQFGEFGSNQQGYQGSLEGALGNPDLTWEKARKFNIGAELIVVKDKFKFVFDYFNEKRDNILANKNTVPAIVAASLPAYNLGIMDNSGYEFDASYNAKYRDLNYWFKFNYTYAHNTIVFQDEVSRQYTYQYRTGQRLGQFFGLVADGIFNSWEEVNDANRPVYEYQNNRIQPGDIRYIDVNGDGKINSDDAVPIGYSSFPEKVFGVSFGGALKGFDFSVLFQGAANVSVAYSRSFVQPFLEGRNSPSYMAESWSFERLEQGLPINFPRFNQGYNINGALHAASSFWTRDASYLRLKNFEVGYTFPSRTLQKVGITYLRAFINGNNLITWDSMLPGVDPESAPAATTNQDPYPVTRTINFGFNVKF